MANLDPLGLPGLGSMSLASVDPPLSLRDCFCSRVGGPAGSMTEMPATTYHDLAVRRLIRLFLQISCPLCGCPYNKSPALFVSISEPLIFGEPPHHHIHKHQRARTVKVVTQLNGQKWQGASSQGVRLMKAGTNSASATPSVLVWSSQT